MIGTAPANYRAHILKVWPERQSLETLAPNQFHVRIDAVLLAHYGHM